MRQAVEIVNVRLDRLGQGGGLLFASRRASGGAVLSWTSYEVAVLKARADVILGKPMARWRLHDIRHTIATLMREDLKVSREVVSMLLGHIEGPASSRIYDRAELLDERRAALVAWAEWLDRLVSGKRKAKVLLWSN